MAAKRRAKKKTKVATKKTARKKAAARVRKKPAAVKKKPAVRKKPARPRTRAEIPGRERQAPKERWALALAGDWSRGAFLLGAVEHFRRTGTHGDPVICAGAGSGALVAALIAQDRWTDLEEFFSRLRREQLVRRRYSWLPGGRAAGFLYSSVAGTESLYLTHEGLERVIDQHVDFAALRNAPCEVHFVAVDMQTGRICSFSNRLDSAEDLRAGLVAAASRPVLMPLARAGYARHQFAEGTLLGNGPLQVVLDAVRRDEAPAVDRVLVLSTAAPAPAHRTAQYRDIGEILDRTAGLLTARRGAREVRGARLINALIGLREQMGPKRFAAALGKLDADTRAEVERHLGKRAVPIAHIHPESPPGAGPLECDPAASRAARDAGHAAANRWLLSQGVNAKVLG